MKEQFTICLKAREQDIRINVHIDDDQDAVFQKIVQSYPECVNKKSATLNRIKCQLEMVLQDTSLKSELEESIRYFLNGSFHVTN